MDNELLKIFSEELRETRNLARAAEAKAEAAWKQVELNREHLTASIKYMDSQTNDLRELVIITRNQVTEELAYLRKPWWKKLFASQS